MTPAWRRAAPVLTVTLLLLCGLLQILPETPRWPAASAWRAAGAWLAGLWPPATDAAFLQRVLGATLATLAMATLGTLGAHLIGVPLALLGNARVSVSAVGRPMAWWARAARVALRAAMLLLRSVPELVWALLLVRLVGLGPLAGTLAIALGGAGLVAKVHAEALESVPRAPIDAALANGAGRWQVLVSEAVPRCRDELLSYSVYRWECALRTSAVLGLVGAGGLGQELDLSLRFGANDEVMVLLTLLIALVWLADAVGNGLRAPAAAHPGKAGAGAGTSAGAGAWRARVIRTVSSVLVVALVIGSVASYGSFEAFLLHDPLDALARFAADFLPPDVPAERWPSLWRAARETLAMSFVGIVLASLLALPLALLARAGPRRTTMASSTVLRGVPELIWALLLVIVLGLGPLTGCAAIAIHNTGVLVRLFVASLDAFDDPAGAALRANGASRSGTFLFATLPGVLPRLLAHVLYRWEHAIRVAAVLGVVGAGGLGQSLHVSLGLFRLQEAAGTILAMMVLVAGVDLVSFAVRRYRVD